MSATQLDTSSNMAIDPPSTAVTTLQLEAHLETLSETIVHEFNKRPLSLSSPTWRHMFSGFTASFDCPLAPAHNLSLEQWIKSVQNVIDANPDYRVEVSSKTPYVYPRSNQAEVFVVFRMSGFAQTDTVMQVMGTFEFIYMDLRWQCRSYSGLGEMLIPVGDMEMDTKAQVEMAATS
ncbi:hypothetical protein M409DRAFT_29637 [Zasmidium cellare ATCC 36951]|uniref:SnoaL-like domain-containing protein n=1 Tax=Zasmidium cellare ATCC 36951 TaxID=1080233 RepID=A0A6A6BYE4_ZASCE|nr:uncharacterized protein M409DRAFT_29637 [Zasmidium cellare ATCC 36951]KAF2159827.1 hypothetical protein M409DRAFT_29637 [Zasmidium cellare ATCC 36951]